MFMTNLKDKLKHKKEKREELKKMEENKGKELIETKKLKAMEDKIRGTIKIEIEQTMKDEENKILENEIKQVRTKFKGYNLSSDDKDELIIRLIILTRDHRSIMNSMIQSLDADIIKFCEND